MGLVVLIVIWLITFISSTSLSPRHGGCQPEPLLAAAGIDHHFATTYLLMGIVFVLRNCRWDISPWKYRERPSSPPARYVHGNNMLEIVWTVLTAILFIGLNLMSSSIWASERFRPAEAGATQVEVTGMQFQWYFRYPGPDGKFGATKPELIDASAGGESAVGWIPATRRRRMML